MGRKEVEGEREVGRGKYCEGFDEDVGYGFVFGEVRVELVSEKAQDLLVWLLRGEICLLEEEI